MGAFFNRSAENPYAFEKHPEPWAKVRTGYTVKVYLVHGTGLLVRSRNDRMVEVVNTTTYPASGMLGVEIAGHYPGETVVEAVDPKTALPQATMRVDVFSPLTVNVNLFRVLDRDGQGTPYFHLADFARRLDQLNAIYQPQTNIAFRLQLLQEIRLRADITTPRQTQEEMDEIERAFTRKSHRLHTYPGSISIFWVKDWNAAPGWGTTPRPGANFCIIDDATTRVLAHEIGHCLGETDINGEENLMCTTAQDTRIARPTALTFRRGAAGRL